MFFGDNYFFSDFSVGGMGGKLGKKKQIWKELGHLSERLKEKIK